LRQALVQQASTGMTNGSDAGIVDSLTERDLPILEELLATASEVERETLWDDWLPKAGGAYAALSGLRDSDVVARRGAANKLAEAARGRTLPGPVLQRLAQTISVEQDPLVFRSVLRAVTDDSTEDARQIAKAALHSPWDDIRLAGIEYVARHRLAEAAAWLLPIIDSPNDAPRRAAVTAAGLCGNPLVLDGTRDAQGEVVYGGLRPLLGTTSLELRREVVLAMARLGDRTRAGLGGPGDARFGSGPVRRRIDEIAVGRTGHARATRGFGDVGRAGSAGPTPTLAGDRHPRRTDRRLGCLGPLENADLPVAAIVRFSPSVNPCRPARPPSRILNAVKPR
jgi:hypothetical protein